MIWGGDKQNCVLSEEITKFLACLGRQAVSWGCAGVQPQPHCRGTKQGLLYSWLSGAIYGPVLRLVHTSQDHFQKASMQICFNEISNYTDIQCICTYIYGYSHITSLPAVGHYQWVPKGYQQLLDLLDTFQIDLHSHSTIYYCVDLELGNFTGEKEIWCWRRYSIHSSTRMTYLLQTSVAASFSCHASSRTGSTQCHSQGLLCCFRDPVWLCLWLSKDVKTTEWLSRGLSRIISPWLCCTMSARPSLPMQHC